VRDSVTTATMGNGEEGGSPKCHVTFFQNFEPYFSILVCFLEGKGLFFWKIKMSKWGRGPRQCYQMTHGEGGVQNRPKQCHILFEWPLKLFCEGCVT